MKVTDFAVGNSYIIREFGAPVKVECIEQTSKTVVLSFEDGGKRRMTDYDLGNWKLVEVLPAPFYTFKSQIP